MKYIILLFLLFTMGVCRAQSVGTPYWINSIPSADGENYYYRVTSAEAENYEKAYTKAFAMAILESSWKLGVAVNKNDDIATIEGNLTDNLKLRSVNMNLPINKVCEYSEQLLTSNGVRIYILWQVARYGNSDPEFDDFNKCW